MTFEFFSLPDVVGLVVTMGGEDGQYGGVRGGDEFDPVARRHVQALGRGSKHPFPLGLTVVGGNPERSRHGDQELVAGPVRMPASGDAGSEIVKVEFPANLERQLLPGFRKSEHSTLVTT